MKKNNVFISFILFVICTITILKTNDPDPTNALIVQILNLEHMHYNNNPISTLAANVDGWLTYGPGASDAQQVELETKKLENYRNTIKQVATSFSSEIIQAQFITGNLILMNALWRMNYNLNCLLAQQFYLQHKKKFIFSPTSPSLYNISWNKHLERSPTNMPLTLQQTIFIALAYDTWKIDKPLDLTNQKNPDAQFYHLYSIYQNLCPQIQEILVEHYQLHV